MSEIDQALAKIAEVVGRNKRLERQLKEETDKLKAEKERDERKQVETDDRRKLTAIIKHLEQTNKEHCQSLGEAVKKNVELGIRLHDAEEGHAELLRKSANLERDLKLVTEQLNAVAPGIWWTGNRNDLGYDLARARDELRDASSLVGSAQSVISKKIDMELNGIANLTEGKSKMEKVIAVLNKHINKETK